MPNPNNHRPSEPVGVYGRCFCWKRRSRGLNVLRERWLINVRTISVPCFPLLINILFRKDIDAIYSIIERHQWCYHPSAWWPISSWISFPLPKYYTEFVLLSIIWLLIVFNYPRLCNIAQHAAFCYSFNPIPSWVWLNIFNSTPRFIIIIRRIIFFFIKMLNDAFL